MKLPKVSKEEIEKVMAGKTLRLPYGDGDVLVVYMDAGKINLRPLRKRTTLERPDTAGEGGSQPQLL